jgi:ergothioneine biosynthesis protein EgtB
MEQQAYSPTAELHEGKAAKLLARYETVRAQTEAICAPLHVEDFVVQPIVDVSPPKWHLAHTTWFWEAFILEKYFSEYHLFNEHFPFLFNSYYESLGERWQRTERGNLTRPTVEEVYAYRAYVNKHMERLLRTNNISDELVQLVELGLNHEQQHQELLVTDIKYILGHNPLYPAYSKQPEQVQCGVSHPMLFLEMPEGLYDIGHQGKDFCFDNELGAHKVYLHAYRIADRLVTNGEYLEFMTSGGYTDPDHWHMDGWEWLKQQPIKAPLYWHKENGRWYNYTLAGYRPVDNNEPVTHISFYEAAAYARWAGKRLLTEFEWEAACRIYGYMDSSSLLDGGMFHPQCKRESSKQLLGDAWEWTNSAYLPYPYYTQAKGALGEYNGKFMINQMILRGGSCATPESHMRLTYRNFFQPDKRWQFTGIRLGESIKND